MTQKRVAIIGAGDIVKNAYLPILKDRDDCLVSMICSKSAASVKQVADIYNIPEVTTKYHYAISNPDIDVVFICTPTFHHYSMVKLAMEHGKHILVEKPLCTNYFDSHRIILKAKEYNKAFFVAFSNAYRPENRWIRSESLSGKHGRVEIVNLQWMRALKAVDKKWLFNHEMAGGGALMDLGTHLIHFGLSLVPNRQNYTALGRSIHHHLANSDVEDIFCGMIKIDDETTLMLEVAWDLPLKKPRVNIEAICEKQVLSNRVAVANSKSPFDEIVDEFLEMIESGARQDFNLVDDTMSVINALYQSANKNTAVKGVFYE